MTSWEWGRQVISPADSAKDSDKQTRHGLCGRCGYRGKVFMTEFGPTLRWLCSDCSTHHARLADSIDTSVAQRAA